jgi:hypothetical protein
VRIQSGANDDFSESRLVFMCLPGLELANDFIWDRVSRERLSMQVSCKVLEALCQRWGHMHNGRSDPCSAPSSQNHT